MNAPLPAAATASAEQASSNVSTVAAAAEQLSASIHEISRQVHESADTSSKAVAEAQMHAVPMAAEALIRPYRRVGV